MINDNVLTFAEIHKHIDLNLPDTMEEFLNESNYLHLVRNRLTDIEGLVDSAGIDKRDAVFSPPILHPPKIWCIGLNYRDHASDLSEKPPTEPASFMRPANTMIGAGMPIKLPSDIGRVTAEAELGLIYGKSVRNIERSRAMDAIIGFISIVDVTALDILQRNPRFLTRAKSYDTFFSVGPAIYVPDEIPPLEDIRVSTVLNGKRERTNTVRNMTFDPSFLVSFHSHVYTTQPGDILSTGTPGAVLIKPGDVVRCEIDGLPVPALQNPIE